MNQGTLEDRYEVYVACTEAAGEIPKSFDEWLNS